MIALSAKNVSRFYGSNRGVENLSFELIQNEVLGVLGLNGAGKSTLLKLLANLLRPTEGCIELFGEEVSSGSLETRRQIGYLPDHPPIYEDMTVVDYLRFLFGLRVNSSQGFSERLEIILSSLNLKDVADRPIGELSHGFKQRVNLAQALVHQPKILILDEPMNGLDPVQIFEMRKLILELKKSHTIILSSHLLSEITKTCDRMLIIHEGKVLAQGTENSLRELGKTNFTYRSTIRGKVPMELLKRIVEKISNTAKVELVSKIDEQQFRITSSLDCGADILKSLIMQDVNVLEFYVEHNDFENTFVELLRQES